MKRQTMTGVCALLVASVIGNTDAWAAKKSEEEAPLTQAGQKLEERYAGMLATNKAGVFQAIPKLDEGKKNSQ